MPRICILDGNHTPGSDWQAECPQLRAAARSERSRKAAETRYAPRQHPVARSEGVDSPEAGYREMTSSAAGG